MRKQVSPRNPARQRGGLLYGSLRGLEALQVSKPQKGKGRKFEWEMKQGGRNP